MPLGFSSRRFLLGNSGLLLTRWLSPTVTRGPVHPWAEGHGSGPHFRSPPGPGRKMRSMCGAVPRHGRDFPPWLPHLLPSFFHSHLLPVTRVQRHHSKDDKGNTRGSVWTALPAALGLAGAQSAFEVAPVRLPSHPGSASIGGSARDTRGCSFCGTAYFPWVSSGRVLGLVPGITGPPARRGAPLAESLVALESVPVPLAEGIWAEPTGKSDVLSTHMCHRQPWSSSVSHRVRVPAVAQNKDTSCCSSPTCEGGAPGPRQPSSRGAPATQR